MLRRTRRPTPAGEILKAHYLDPRGISVAEFARAVECSRKHMSNVVHGRARVEANLAARIARALGTTPQFWLNLQNAVDVYEAEHALRDWKPPKVYTAKSRTIKNAHGAKYGSK